jgi:uncharacterized protein (TIGR02284 family)
MTTDYDIDILNDLIVTTIDSVDGYRKAGADAETNRFQAMFMSRATERDGVVTQLQNQVRALGGTPADDGSLSAGAHRLFMGLREIVSGRDDDAIIAEVEHGEDNIKAKFEQALNDKDVSVETIQVISKCFTSVKSGHDQMRDLKHNSHGTHPAAGDVAETMPMPIINPGM